MKAPDVLPAALFFEECTSALHFTWVGTYRKVCYFQSKSWMWKLSHTPRKEGNKTCFWAKSIPFFMKALKNISKISHWKFFAVFNLLSPYRQFTGSVFTELLIGVTIHIVQWASLSEIRKKFNYETSLEILIEIVVEIGSLWWNLHQVSNEIFIMHMPREDYFAKISLNFNNW